MCIPAQLIAQASGITCDSREVKPGSIFVAIHGRTADGNTYIHDAVAQGALAVVTDQPPPLAIPIPVYLVPNARQALAQLAAEYFGHPSRELKLIGVTGTNGKTTVTYMLEHIFRSCGLNTGLIGTVQVHLGKASYPSTLTTPDAATLQRYLRQMRQNAVTHAAIEVSAQGIEMHRADQLTFTCGILTNISPDHLDFHGDYPAYVAAKSKFLQLLSPATPLIVNQDDPVCRELAAAYTGPVIDTSLLHNQAAVSAAITALGAYGSQGILTFQADCCDGGCGQLPFRLLVPGRHNVANALAAIAAATLSGIPLTASIAALTTYKGVERRMNLFHLEGRTVIDDTALNPGSIDAVFATLQHLRYRRLVVVNAIRGRRGPAINAANATTLAGWQHQLAFQFIVTAATDCVGSSDQVTDQEQAAFSEALATEQAGYVFTETLNDALQLAYDDTMPGDLLVLLGAQGMDQGRRILMQTIAKAWNEPNLQFFRPIL